MSDPFNHLDPTTALRDQVQRLHQEILTLRRENQDLQIALATTAEHGDFIQAELHQANQRLATEIVERQEAQATLQTIYEKIAQDKADLEVILEATTEHGDVLEYDFYTQAVESMRQSEDLFRAIAESTPILMLLSPAIAKAITYANSTALQRLGPTSEEVLGQTLADFAINPTDITQLQHDLSRDGLVRDYELRLCDRYRKAFWALASVSPITLNGEPMLLTTLYDISDRKQIELLLRASEDQLREQVQTLERRVEERTAALQQAEANYREIFEYAAEGIFQISATGRYLKANPALANLLGYASAAQLMENLQDVRQQLYVRPGRWHELMAYIKQFGSLSKCESQVYRQDRSPIWISENIRPVFDAQERLLYYEGSVWDVTQRKHSEAALRQQQQTSERLLLNVLPSAIAERLKQGQTSIADYHDDVTVMFADIVNFTELSAQMSPEALLDLLNQVFSRFDKLVDYYRLEKIKTIGDAYMVAGGLPHPQADALGATIDMALEMLAAVQQFNLASQPIRLRIGIHTGPVIAGVIGVRRFIYDLWGDTVNLASRLESQGEADRIQVSAAVYHRLAKRYQFTPRGQIAIKGCGDIATYWLAARKVHI